MVQLPIFVAFLVGVVQSRSTGDSSMDPFALPKGLLIGAGVSAFQTEGAWNVSGKAESAADHVLHLGRLSSLGYGDPHGHDVAANSYYRYKEDIAMAKKLKLSLYRFSISWSRVLPDTTAANPNKEGVEYYHNLIDEILRNNMTPMATLYHFDHPQILEDQFKGWKGEEMVAKFKEYARFAFNEYAGKVKLWVTVNEPNVYCMYFPNLYKLSGLYTDSDVQRYNCMRHMVLAHAEAYHVFQEDNHEGRLAFSALLTPAKPNSTRAEDVYTAEVYNDLVAGLALGPVVHGDWPQNVKDVAGSKVPEFSEEEKQLLKGTVDFLAINIYYPLTVGYKHPNSSRGDADKAAELYDIMFAAEDYDFLPGESAEVLFSRIQPEAMRMGVLWAWQKYRRPLLLAENGFGDIMHRGTNDEIRAAYHSAYLRTLVTTVKDFGVDVLGYCVWSLIDCFEWSWSYKRVFGLVHVDYENGSLNRTLKDSSKFWIEMAETGIVPFVGIPSSTPGTSSSAGTSFRSWLLALTVFLTFVRH